MLGILSWDTLRIFCLCKSHLALKCLLIMVVWNAPAWTPVEASKAPYKSVPQPTIFSRGYVFLVFRDLSSVISFFC